MGTGAAGRARTQLAAFAKPLSTRDMAHLCHNLARLYDGGVPLVNALKAMEDTSGSRSMRYLVRDLRAAIESGATLGQAAHFHRARLSPLFVEMVGVTERAGALGDALPHLAAYYDDMRRMYHAVIRQVAYPIAVLVGIFVGIPLLQAFMADIAGISSVPFEEAAFTILFGFALQVIGAILLITVVARITFRFTTRESVLMHAGPFAAIARRMLLARFAWAMMIFTRTGIVLHRAVPLAGKVTGASRIARDFEKIGPMLQQGATLSDALAQSRFFPPKVLAYVHTAEVSGKLDECFERLARDLYDESIFRLRIFVGIIEPAAIIAIGLFVIMRLV